ncbi:MAG TPA: TolC family protein [Candidatus Baltobacteraceae bacterium]|nr:TolC family protein [Candidatus Baltobacteraceae bacterium]
MPSRGSVRAVAAWLALLATLCTSTALAQPSPSTTAVALSLDDAIAVALKQNLQYQSARVAVQTSLAQLTQARAPELPGLAIQDTYQYVSNIAELSTPLGPIPFSTVKDTNVPIIALQYTLFDGGLTAARVGQSVAGLAASEASRREVRGTVIAGVASAYYGLLSAFQMKAVAQRAVNVAAAHVAQARQLLAQGLIARADLLRAQAEEANEELNEISAANAVDLAQVSLDNVMGVPLTKLYDPTDRLDAPAPPLHLDSLIASAHAQRGELAAAQAAVTAARRAVEAAQAGHWPSIKTTVADGNTQPAVIGGYHNQFSVELSAVWALFDNGYTAGRVAEARAAVEQAQLGVSQLGNGIDLQVRQAYLNVTEAQARVSAARRLVILADENLRLAQVRYRGGVGTALELQDAELRDRSAQQALTGAFASLRQSVVAVRFAAGLL